MIFVALQEAADKGELLLVESGLCRFHRRRDGVVVIREMLVLPQHQRQGIGTALFREVLGRAKGSVIRAKCPTSYISGNAFWKKMGFTLISTENEVNTWQRPSQG